MKTPALLVSAALCSLLIVTGCKHSEPLGTAQTAAGKRALQLTAAALAETSAAVASQVSAPAEAAGAEVRMSGPDQATDGKALQGHYVGLFDPRDKEPEYSELGHKLTLTIESVEGSELKGRSILSGNPQRPFQGSLKSLGKGRYFVLAQEPGSIRHNGEFEFILDTDDMSVKGSWDAKDAKLDGWQYELRKKAFSYKPANALVLWPEIGIGPGRVHAGKDLNQDKSESFTEDAVKINASTTLLRSKDVENMYRRDLELMRNAIYARHGYAFKDPTMRYFFENGVEWYVPVSNDVSQELTPLERQNEKLLKIYEQHATSYYAHFGR